MRQTKHSFSRHRSDRYFAAGTLGAVIALGLFGCEYDDGEWQLDQESGATSSRGGTKGSSGGATNRSGSSNVSGDETGGAGEVPDDYPAPKIDSMAPTSGP